MTGLQKKNYSVVVIGGGPAGMAAALAASETCERVLILERNPQLGGILNQCIHDGFGLLTFQELLTGPEYAGRFEDLIGKSNITVLTGAIVIRLTPQREILCVTRDGVLDIQAGAVVLATGCRERTRGALAIPGTRPSGIYTAGVAQHLINIQNIKIGNTAVILGSGDIGMIMARRLTLEGMKVLCVLEKLPYCSGLPRNRFQCLNDYGIPLHLNQTVREIRGAKRVEQIVVASVDEKGDFLPGTEYTLDCDTLILSVGLIPENELARDCGIAMEPGTYVRPHRHPHTWELLLPLRGRFLVLHFDAQGTVQRRTVLGTDCALVENEAGAWHAVIALDPGCIIFEVKHGPYRPLTEADYAPWSPAAEAAPEARAAIQAWYGQAALGDRYPGA